MRPYLPPILASVTLGLAPFAPTPHVVGKLRWVLGGAQGMALSDWADLAFHGSPWVWLAWTAARGAVGPDRGRRWVGWAVVGALACVLWATLGPGSVLPG